MGVVHELRAAEFAILQASLPGRPLTNIGVVVIDRERGDLAVRVREAFDAVADPDDAEVLEHLREWIEQGAAEHGAGPFFAHLEDTFSGAVRLTGRERVTAGDLRKTARRLYHEHVERPEVLPFRTHLPLYSLRAAATRFGGDMEVAGEPEAWIEAPEGLRLSESMFVARVVGRSMEPLIPDGSLCVFRAGVTGSRHGKRLLIRHRGTSASGGEYTVKRYTSVKATDQEGGWRHARIRLEPLNPEFEAFELSSEDEFQVIGEFVQVLDE